MFEYDHALIGTARRLRKNMTSEEKRLWYEFLCKLPVPAKRQKNIANYILDFYIPKAKIAIEVDGSQHGEPEHALADAKRDAMLQSLGITVLRYRNTDVNRNLAAVERDIIENIRKKGVEI